MTWEDIRGKKEEDEQLELNSFLNANQKEWIKEPKRILHFLRKEKIFSPLENIFCMILVGNY